MTEKMKNKRRKLKKYENLKDSRISNMRAFSRWAFSIYGIWHMGGIGGVPHATMSKIVPSHQPTLVFSEFKIGAKSWALPHLCFSSRGKREKPDTQTEG